MEANKPEVVAEVRELFERYDMFFVLDEDIGLSEFSVHGIFDGARPQPSRALNTRLAPA